MDKIWILTRDSWNGRCYDKDVVACFVDKEIADHWCNWYKQRDNADVGGSSLEEVDLEKEIPTWMEPVK